MIKLHQYSISAFSHTILSFCASHLLNLIGLISVGLLASCTSVPVLEAVAPKTVSAVPIPEVEETWPEFVDAGAQEYLAHCFQQHQTAQQYLQALVEQRHSSATLLDALDELDRLTYGVAAHASLYGNVHPNGPIREASQICEQRFMKLIGDIRLSNDIYNRLMSLDVAALSDEDQTYVNYLKRDQELAGVRLSPDNQRRLKQLQAEILKLGQTFSGNIHSDVRVLHVHPDDLRGLPEDFIQAHPVGEDGLVKLTTHTVDYLPFMQYAMNDRARLEMYTLYRMRGYPDNLPVLRNLLKARHELATLLGFSSFADYITSDKMIGSASQAQAFIEWIDRVSEPNATADYDKLLHRLQRIDPKATVVGDWQKNFLETLIKAEEFDVDAQEVRQYFAYVKVKEGLFQFVERLFNVRIVPWKTEVWHPSVEAYEIWENEQLLGQFYLDMHPREGKYRHAAHFGIRDGVQGLQTPMAALVCNIPGDSSASDLMEHHQVKTLFHEFGHLLHTIFSGNATRMRLSAGRVQRDFIEVPAKIFEELAWHKEALNVLAQNAFGQTLPEQLLKKMQAARHFGEGIWAQHQNYYAALSLYYYSRNPENLDLDHIARFLQNQYSPFEYVENTYMYANFGHLDSYPGIYYTYLWSKMIAADMLSVFQEQGLTDPEVMDRYRKIVLEQGAAKPASLLVEEFLGRPFNWMQSVQNVGSQAAASSGDLANE